VTEKLTPPDESRSPDLRIDVEKTTPRPTAAHGLPAMLVK
jgi:hypothetical protein